MKETAGCQISFGSFWYTCRTSGTSLNALFSHSALLEALVVFSPFLLRLVRIDDLRHLPWIMTFSSSRFLRATSIKHHNRGLTLVFGSGGQVSLIEFDDGITSQPLGVPTVSCIVE